MFFLSTSRSAIARSAWKRGLMLLLAWIMVAAEMPRWELHAHEDATHGHAHGSVFAELSIPIQAAEGGAALHLHDVSTASVTLPALLRLDLHSLAPNRWIRAVHSGPAPAAAWPPPHRPPIA